MKIKRVIWCRKEKERKDGEIIMTHFIRIFSVMMGKEKMGRFVRKMICDFAYLVLGM